MSQLQHNVPRIFEPALLYSTLDEVGFEVFTFSYLQANILYESGHVEAAVETLLKEDHLESPEVRASTFILGKNLIQSAIADASITGIVNGRDIFRQLASKMYQIYLGEQGIIQEAALNVAQGQFGLSDSLSLGTHSVFNCASLALHDPRTKLTLVSHLDEHGDLASIENLVSNAIWSDSQVLQARLLGFKTVTLGSGKLAQSIDRLLTRNKIELLSADTFCPDQPSAWIVSPSDFAARAGVPTSGPDEMIQLGRIRCNTTKLPVTCAFDFRNTGQPFPIELDAQQAEYLQVHYQGNTFLELARNASQWDRDNYYFFLETILRLKDSLKLSGCQSVS